ncbi:MAG: beta-lactamase family protein [Desulfurococcales archaeon]|nr:beta-lactamase family protein [Desulfurococcales archaeon]
MALKGAEVLHRVVLDKVSRYRMPSLTISVRVGGKPFFERAYGFSSLEEGRPARTSTVYGVGSITKILTAMSIMSLVEDGKLSLDDSVGKVLGVDLKVKGEPVRIWHLLSHTSGIPAPAYAEALLRGFYGYPSYWRPYSNPWDAVEYLRMAVERGWAVDYPGRRFFYLNEGYVALGLIVEKVSGESFQSYVRKRILEPLGMDSSFFIGEKPPEGVEVAEPYAPRDGGLSRVPVPQGILADGGLMTNVIDLQKLLQALAARGRIGEVEVLSRRSVDEMERIRATTPWQPFGCDGYGLGLMVHRRTPMGLIAGHGGSLLAYTAYAAYSPETGVTVAIASNTTGYPLQVLGFLAVALAVGLSPRDIRPFMVLEALEAVEGRYEGLDGNVVFNVRRLGWGLVLETPDAPGQAIVLTPVDVDEGHIIFEAPYMGSTMRVEFLVGTDGKVEAFIERYRAVKAGRAWNAMGAWSWLKV